MGCDAGDCGFEVGGVEKVLGYGVSELEVLGSWREGSEFGEDP